MKRTEADREPGALCADARALGQEGSPRSMKMRGRALAAAAALVLACACSRGTGSPGAPSAARNLVLITVDTLRADRVGAYGHAAARTPTFDALAARGTRFQRAFAPAPITLTSHASLLTGRYPPGHGGRHNGMAVSRDVPLLAEALARAGFATAAFVGAFPLDRRFGLDRGFETYGDRMPRLGGRQAHERAGRDVVDEALSWLERRRAQRFFLWLHLFEPHAPYAEAPGAAAARPVALRYDDEIAEADRQAGRLLGALGADSSSTLVVATSDHGEAFGEHGEIAHSVFIYDTTLRVPLVIAGPGVGAHTVEAPVSLVDVAPTVMRLLGLGSFDADGIDLGAALRGGTLAARTLYAESYAPLLDFGWSPLRSVREGGWKYIEAPRPELYRTVQDPHETRDMAAAEPARAAELRQRVERYPPLAADAARGPDAEAAQRLQALGYVGAGRRERGGPGADPKDRRELAAAIAHVMSGELRGAELEQALRRILTADRGNPQAHLRLGFALQETGRCTEALSHFSAAIAAGVPGADPYLGLAGCQTAAGDFAGAEKALRTATQLEPGNPVVAANLGIVLSDSGRPADGVAPLERALAMDPDFHQARFNLAIALARTGRKADARREAAELLRRLPPDAPQRAEVQRLIDAVK